MMCKYFLENADGFGLEEKPLSIQQFLDLQQVEKDSFVQLFFVDCKFLISQEHHVFSDDTVLCQNGKLWFLVVLSFLETMLILPSSMLSLVALKFWSIDIHHFSLILGGRVFISFLTF